MLWVEAMGLLRRQSRRQSDGHAALHTSRWRACAREEGEEEC